MLPASVRILVCTVPQDMRNYAESGVMRSGASPGAITPRRILGRAPHNHDVGRERRRDAISLSGARKRPRLSVGGRTASMASSFSVGSART
jgi:hypothetical protein